MSATTTQREQIRTLGRSGYRPDAKSQLAIRVEQLDALMIVITARDTDGSSDPEEGFGNCNREIQYAVLDLASSLAQEIHELLVVIEAGGAE